MAEATGLRNNALPYPVYGAPYGLIVPSLDADGDPVAFAAQDSEISKNGDSFADCTNEAVEIATGIGYLLLTATEMTADVIAVQVKTTNGKTTVFSLYPRKLVPLRSGTAQGGAAGSITLDASAGGLDDKWNGCLCVATLDSAVEARIITDYTGSTQVAAVTPDWNTTPDSDDTFIIYLPEGMQIPTGDTVALGGAAQSATDLKDFADDGYDPSTNKVQGVVLVDTATALGTDAVNDNALADGAVTVIGTGVWASTTRLLTAGTNIVLAKGTGVTGFNDLSAAQVNTEVDTAIADARLDELLNADSDIDGAAPPTVGSVFHELMSKTAGSFTFDQTTDSVEAIRDRGDAAWITATGFSTHSAADVWAVGTRVLTAGTNIALAKGTGVTGFNDLSSAEVNAEVVDVMRTDTLPDSYAADGSQPTIAQAVLMIAQFLMERSVSGTTVTVRKPDGSTSAMTFTLNDATSPTSITRG